MTSGKPLSYIQPMPVRQRIQLPQPKGLPRINMGFNELPFEATPGVKKAIEETPVYAYGEPTNARLRAALSETHGLPADNIICGNGSEDILDVIGRCFARPGDEILISQFGYILFSLIAGRTGAALVKAPETDFCTNVAALLQNVTDRTRIVYLANPNNPTGTMCSLEELERLASNLPGHIVLTIDLAYGEFVGPDYNAAVHDLAQGFDNIVIARTFSKAYGLAGLRVGWAYASEALIPPLYAGRGLGPVNAVGQAAAHAVLQQPEIIAERIGIIVAERDRAARACEALGLRVVPSSTNFLLAGLPGDDGSQADALAEHLFNTAGIIVNRTREAGLEGFIRFSMSLPEHNDLLIAGIETYMTNVETAP